MNELQSWLNTAAQLAISGGVVWGVYQGWVARRAALVAAAAASVAATRALSINDAVTAMGTNLAELAVNTNSIQEALNKVNREAGNLEGRAEQQAETAAKDTA